MLQCNKIPHLRIFRMKCYLPFIEDNPTRDSAIFYNGLSTQNIDTILNHKTLDNNRSKYRRVYIERKTVQKINKKTITKNFTADRKLTYKALKNSNSSLVGVVEGELKSKLNLVYDFSGMNTLFFSNSSRMSLKKQAVAYIDYIISNMTVPNRYKQKTMFIHVDEWLGNNSMTDLFLNPELMRNPISLFYLCLKYNSDQFFRLGDIDIIFVTTKGPIMRMNPQELKHLEMKHKKPAREYRMMIFKLMGKVIDDRQLDKMENQALDTEANRNEVMDTIMRDFVFGANQTINEDVIDKIESVVKSAEIESVDQTIDEINKNEDLIKDINKTMNFKNTGGHHASTKRDEMLKEKQMDIKVRNTTVKDLISVDKKSLEIPSMSVENKVFTTNSNIKEKRYCNFDKSYNETLKESDFTNIFLDLNNKSIPVYVKSIDVQDSSDVLNYKETYKIVLEDANRVRHNLTFDMPKIIDDKFIYLGGNKKILNNQQILLPIVKTEPDTVQTVTNYNKIFIRRYGDKVSADIEKFKKAITSNNLPGCRFKRGNYSALNAEYLTTMEYDNLSKTFESIKIKDITLEFDQKKLRQELETKKVKIKDGQLPIGYEAKQPLFLDLDHHTVVGTNKSLLEYIGDKTPKLNEMMKEYSVGKKYMYTRATIMKKQVPLVLLLSYFEGLDTLLKRAKIKYYFSDTRPRLSSTEGVVEFKNGYLIYEDKPFEVSLLMNAFVDIPTKSYDYEDFNEKEIYTDIFQTMFDRRGIASAFDHFYDNFVDPITYSVLEDLNLPLDITGMLLYANDLLVDDQFTVETDQTLYRIRRNEIFNAILYKKIATAYEKYSDTSMNSNPKKISIPKNAILKEILTQQTLEDYSVLNPIVELEKVRATSPKGPSGCNLEEAYKLNKRAFHTTMTGLFTISTSPDKNAGVVRELTNEPNIISARGYMKTTAKEDMDELKDVNLFGPAELLSPLGATRDDSIRLAMATKQSKHIVPVKTSSPVLISNGAEQTIQYELTNDFVVVAKEDGTVIERDEKSGLVVVQYKSGKCEAIDISPKTVKNGAGGFYLTNKMECNLKVGQKVKAKDILASDDKFFTNSSITGNRFNIGTLCKVAIMSSYSTYEDSTEITRKMAQEMSTEISMPKQIVLGANTNVEYMVKIGDEVEVGDELIRFERSFDEDSYNKLLANIGDELGQEITMASKDQVKSKYSGKITDIKIYSTVGLDELSPSLRKIVSEYYGKINKRKKLLEKYDKDSDIVKCGILFNEPTGPIETPDGKLKGSIVNDGVLIEIYVTYVDELAIGDKITNFTALKGTVGEIIPEGQEAYTLFRPDEKIDTCIAPAAIIARMTPSIILTLLGNKVIVELKRKLKDIYDGKA